MGAQNTKTDPGYGHLTSEECSKLKKLFQTLNSSTTVVGSKGEKGVACPYGDFQRHCETYLDDWLARRITDKLSVKTPKAEEPVVPLTKYLNFVSSILKGSVEEKVEVIWNLTNLEASTEKRESISVQEITQYTRSVIESYIRSVESMSYYETWTAIPKLTSDSITDFAEFLLTELLYKGVSGKELINQTQPIKSSFTFEEVVDGFSKSQLLLNLHNSIISQCFGLDIESYFVRLLPVCSKYQHGSLPESYTILDLARVLFLNSQLPQELRSEWRFLFSTRVHGESFSKFLGLTVEKGPTLIVLKDETGRIFGGFATDSWSTGPKFFGGDRCFLFHLNPKFAIYSSTGYNQNYQYLNVQQQTFPNGLGLGGKLEYFGLWIEAEFGRGKCAPSCTTFSSPPLSSNENFCIYHLEAWALGPEPKKDENERDISILDKDPETKVMMDLMDKKIYSEGYRDEPDDLKDLN